MSTQCSRCYEVFYHYQDELDHRCPAPDRRDAERYRWLRENPAFETEMLLGGLSPEEFDALVDERRKQ